MSQSSRVLEAGEADALGRQVAAHEGLVQWVVRRQWRGELAFAEALQEGRVGLWRALRGYDPSRGTRFSSYAVPAIAHAVWEAVARAQPSVAVDLVAHEAASAWDDPDERLSRAEVAVALRALVDGLPPRLRQVIVAHYGLEQAPPQSFAALGQALGVSRQRVQQLHALALVWLAQPEHSRSLRRLLERQGRRDYQQALARQRHLARRARRPRRRGR